MAQEQEIVELIIDAGLANAGAQAFEQSANRIQQSSERATASVDKLGQSIDRSGQKMSQAGQRSGAAAMEQHAAATDKATASMRQLAEAHETTIRRMQAGSFNVFDQTATLGALAQYRSQLERGVGPSSLVAVGAPERAGRNATAAAITADSLPLLTDDVFNSVRPTGALARAERFSRQAAADDSSTGGQLAKIHSSEAVAAAALPAGAQAAGNIAGAAAAPEQVVAGSMERLAISNDRAALATQAAAAQSRITAPAAALASAPPAGPPPPGSPTPPQPLSVLTPAEQQSRDSIHAAELQAEQSAAVAAATRQHAAATEGQRSSLSSIAEAQAAHANPSGVNVAEWLQARKPPSPVNDVDVAAFNKSREATDSLWGSVKNFFSGLRSGSADLHGAAEATEGLGRAAEHATGAGGRMREAFVGLREIFRGDFSRLVGSATIELQRFGLLHLLVNPLVLSLGAAVGAMAYLAYKASEIDANLRSFGTTVKVMGDGSLTSAAELEKFTEELKHTGVAGADAKKTIEEIARSGFVKPGQSTADFAGLARDISQYNGEGAAGTPKAAEDLLKAFSGDADGAIKFAESLHALSGPQIAAIHDLDQHAKSGEAFQKIYAAIRAAVPPFIGDLSALQIAFLGIKNTWDDFTTSLAKSDFPSLATAFIEEAIKRLQTTIEELERVAKLARSVKQAFSYPGSDEFNKDFPTAGPGSGVPGSASAPLPPRPLTGGAEVKQGEFLNYAGTLGFTPSQGAALAGQARAESSFNTGAGLQAGAPSDAGKGLFQWDNNRWGQLLAWAQLNGLDPMDYRTQLQFAKKEIPSRSPAFLSASTLSEQNTILTKQFESPKDQSEAVLSKRLGYAEQALGTSTTPFRPTEQQTAAIDLQNQKLKEQLGISSQIAGVDREAVQERIRLQDVAAKTVQFGDRDKYIDEGMIGFFKNRQALFESQHRLNDIEISDTEKIGKAYATKGAVEGLQAETLVQAQRQVREQGGSPAEVPTAQRDIINQRAAAAISASRQQSIEAEPAIAAAESLARASYVSRAEEEKTKIANEAAVRTQNVLNLALLQGSDAYIKEATSIDDNARSQIRRRDAAAQALEGGHQIQANQDQSQVLALELGLQGQSSDAIRTQVELLRARQEIEQRYTALTQGERDAIFASTASVIQQNAVLTQAQEATARLNDAFRGIAGTIDGDLTNSIRNALIRTPAEAGEHLKHFWDEWRAGFKAALGDIVSGLANAAFIKPLTGEIAGALGLGQVAQQTGTFGGLLTGGPARAAGAAGGAGLQGLSGSQLALNVSGLTSGSSVFGANVPGSTVFQSGNTITVQGTGAAVAGPGEAATATTGSAGLSADQIQAILDARPTPLAGSQTTTPLEAALLTISSAAGAPQPTAASTAQAAGGEGPSGFFVPGSETPISGASILQPAELPAAAAAVTGEAAPQQQPITPATATAAASSGLGSISNLGQIAGLLDKLNSNLPGFLPGGLGGGGEGGGLFGNFSDFLSNLNPFATVGSSTAIAGSPAEFLIPGTDTSISGASSLAGATSEGSLFGLPTSATFGSFLGGASAGFGAGSLLNSLIGGNPLGGDIGSAGGAAVGSLIGSIVPGVGTLIGGLIGGLAGGGLGGLVGGPPEGQSAGAVISPTGAIQANTVGGSAANIQQSGSIAQQIGAFVTALNQLTNAQGQKIGTNLATAVVSSNNKSGITVTGTNGVGGQYDQNAAGAVSETELQIVQNLQNVSGTLKTVLANISDPSQLQAAVQFADVYDKLNVTSAQLTASLNGNVDVIGPFQQALTSIQATFSQLTAQAAQFGVDVTPITTALQAVTATLNTDFKTSLDEAFETAISGGNDFIASLVQVHQAFEQNTSDAAALGLTNLDQQIQGIAALQAGTTLATLGIDQLTTVIQDLGQVAPEVAAQAQALISSGNALPDILTQASQALIDPLGLAIEKEKAAGDERVAVAQQTGQSLVEVEELNSANLIQAITSAAGNPAELNAFTYANNPTAQEYLQVAPALAGFSAQQLEAVFAAAFNSSPALADLAQSFVNTGAALPDTITQSLEGIVNPLELAIQQQTAQSQARTQVGVVAGQNLNTVSALNTASITQAIVQQLGNPEALQALAAHGSAAGLTALQAGPAIAGLGLDQLTALINAIGTAAPNLTAMINALIASGNALPDALTQATEAIVESGVLAVQKAQALAYEQVQAAGPAGQNVSEAQTLGAAEVAQATAQATGTEVPLGPLPDWITQLEESVAAPLQLAIQKQQAAGIQQVQIAEATGASLVAVQQEQADAIAQIWYQATQQLTSLKNDLTTGSLSGLTAANQVTASIEQFNTVLGLVQSGNTSFINDLASAGQAAVQAAQTAYGNGPQTQSVREQVYQAITPLLVSSSGYPSSDLAAVAAADTTSGTATGTTTDLQNNTTALENLTTAITSATPGSTASLAGTTPAASSAATAATTSTTSTTSSGISGITTNPVTGESFTGTGITAVAPNYPTFPSASTLSSALADAVASQATAADWATINQAVQAGILNPANQPGYALVIQQAQQWAAGQAVNPSAGLAQALSDAVNGTPTLEEWELINQAVNAGILNAEAQPQYASVIRQAQVIADAQATSLSQIPNNQTAYNTTINGLPAFAAGASSTPPGLIMVGEQGPEWYQAANDNRWAQVGTRGPEILDQAGGAQIIPFPMSPPGFAAGTTGFYVPPSAGSESDASNKALIAEVVALRKQVWASQMNADQNAKAQHALTRQTNNNLGPPISAPARRAVG